MKPIKVKLTIPQHQMFQEIIETHAALGDCRLTGLMLHFDDYEGASATRNAMLSVRTTTTRDYVTWNSVVDRVNKAISEGVVR